MEKKSVVTSFLEFKGKILVLKRSMMVGTHQDKWAGVSGYLEELEEPHNRALQEIVEEVGLTPKQVQLIRKGKPLVVPDLEKKILWIVHPFLFRAESNRLRLNWEHSEYRWIRPNEIRLLRTVPKLTETYERVSGHRSGFVLDDEVLRRIKHIKADHRSGASQLARETLRVMKFAAEKQPDYGVTDVEEYINYLKFVGGRLMEVRPSIAALYNCVGFFLHEVLEKHGNVDQTNIKTFTASKAEELIKQSESASEMIAQETSKLIGTGKRIMTHSYSSTVLKAFRCLFQNRKQVQAIVTESRPLYEGISTARVLSKIGIPVTFIVDSAAGCFMEKTDVVLIGADSILADGSAVNKIGTYMIALAARERHVPFYIVCEKLKFNTRSLWDKEAVVLEEKEPLEVLKLEIPARIKVRNIYFDITPSKYISGIITEGGLIKPTTVYNYIEKMLSNMYLG